MSKRILAALGRLMSQWKQADDQREAQALWRQQLSNQMMNANQSWTVTTTTTNANTAFGAPTPNAIGQTMTSGSTYQMGGALSGYGALGSGMTSGYYNTYSPYGSAVYLTDEQLAHLIPFIERAMQHSWECLKCGRHYAPLTPDCEFCNLIARLEGAEQEASKVA